MNNDSIRTIPPSPEEYNLTVSVAEKSPSYSITSNSESNEFIGASAITGFKSYVVARDDCLGTIVYVGITTRSMKERFRDGFRSTDNNDTYTWALEKGKYKLLVWDLSKIVKDKIELQAIEAELTFSVRVMQRSWPTGQKSITFYYFRMSKTVQIASLVATIMIRQYFDFLANRKTLTNDRLQIIKYERDRVEKLLKELSLTQI